MNPNDEENGNCDNGDEINEPEQLRKLFVGGLDNRTTDEDLRNHFGQFGDIVDVVVMKDPKTKRTRGFGFVTYSHSYMVDQAQNNRPHEIHGRIVEPKRAVPRHEADQPNAGASVKKLFVGGLRDDHDEECLHDYFKEFGNICTVQIMVEKDTGKNRGFAFVEFDDYDPVDKVILRKNHTVKNKALHVQKAIPKDGMDRQGRGAGGGGRGGARGGGQGWGGNRGNQGGSWGGNSYGNGNYGATNQGWGSNQPAPWGGQQGGGSDGGWNSNQGGYGGNMGSSWNNGGGNFGNDYQQGYGGGPQRSNYGGNRSAPYNAGFKAGNQANGGSQGAFTNNYTTGGSMGGGNRRY